MSNYTLIAKRNKDGFLQKFRALDDHFGKHRYGYKDESGFIFNEETFDEHFEIVDSTPTPSQHLDSSWEERFDKEFPLLEDIIDGYIGEFCGSDEEAEKYEKYKNIKTLLAQHKKI